MRLSNDLPQISSDGCSKPHDLDDFSRDALRSFTADLGAERAFLFDAASDKPVVLIEAATDEPPAAPRSIFRWSDGDVRPLLDEDRVLNLSLRRKAGRDLAVAVVFASPDLRNMHFVGIAVRRLTPLLEACLDLWLRGRAERDRNAGLEAAAHLSGLGVLVLDGDDRLLFANRQAETLMAAGDGLRRAGASIAATALKDAMDLQDALDQARRGGPAAVPILRLRRPGDARPLIMTITCQLGSNADRTEPLTVLHVLDPECDVRGLIGPVCDLHGLSGMERAIATEIANGSTVAEAAAALGVKLQTARTYLKQIFIKTDTHRQTDLVRLLLLSTAQIALPARIKKKRS